MTWLLIFSWLATTNTSAASFTATFPNRMACHAAAQAHINTARTAFIRQMPSFAWNCLNTSTGTNDP